MLRLRQAACGLTDLGELMPSVASTHSASYQALLLLESGGLPIRLLCCLPLPCLLIDEARKGHLGRDELARLHVSIGINHSMTEDPTLFAVIGLPAFWLWVPRFVAAVVAVQLYRLGGFVWGKLRAGA